MEKAQQIYGVRSLGKRNSEWDLNQWKWDGDLFIASPVASTSIPSNFQGHKFVQIPVTAGQSSNSSSTCSDDLNPEPDIQRGPTSDLDRKRRVILLDDDENDREAGRLSLNLGGYPYLAQSQVGLVRNLDETSGKRTKVAGNSLSRAACQVEGCGADLSNAKDYHRRHKVCEMHSKATQAFVGNVMQRFCQQCSRFHVLHEFDEGKRSCRRRLAGHNKRRRKAQPEPVMSVQPANDEQASNYILISLLRLLSNMQTNNRSDPTTDCNLVAHLTKSLASQSGLPGSNNIPALLHESQKLLNGAIAEVNTKNISAFLSGNPPRPIGPTTTPTLEVPHKQIHSDTQAASSQKSDVIFLKDSPPTFSEVRDSAVGKPKLNNFDLNDIYVDSDDGADDLERSPGTGTGSVDCPSWAQQDSLQSSPPQVSGNSDSASALSPSSSSGEAQSRTDRIVFKLFGKEPSEFPSALRKQILGWLAHSPTEIESYIRPGCVILTIYLRLADPVWEELSSDLGSSISRLLDIPEESFWQTGWVYTRVENQITFCYNGQIVVNKSLTCENSYCSRILSVTPIAVSISELAQFQIMGSNLSRPSTRLLCALEGKYLALESHQDSSINEDTHKGDDDDECINLSCSIPSVTGRGFIEVEDEDLSSSFFPFIVAEKDVCSEIRMLESILASTNIQEPNGKWEAKHLAMDFIHELGWLLHRCQVKSKLGHHNPNTELFSLKRFRWLVEFSMDHEWCSVVRKLLDILLEGNVSYGEHPSLDLALSEIGLLHRAVRKNSRRLVELLLRYIPFSSSEDNFLFRPDVKGPAGLTPLHIAAGLDGSEAMVDALTNDPGKVGIEAWKSAQDSTGSTPEDYARLRGHYSYIRLVDKKLPSRELSGCVVIEMPDDIKTRGSSKSSLEIASRPSINNGPSCRACESKMMYGFAGRSNRVYRPAMLSMVAIAAVCVCVALFFKTSPVVYIVRPFRWESLDFGSI
ncbi:hypothetical protein V2J09_020142 [Rumex salicifolius]